MLKTHHTKAAETVLTTKADYCNNAYENSVHYIHNGYIFFKTNGLNNTYAQNVIYLRTKQMQQCLSNTHLIYQFEMFQSYTG